MGVRVVYKEGQKDMDESPRRQGASGMGCYGGAGWIPRSGRTVESHDAEGWRRREGSSMKPQKPQSRLTLSPAGLEDVCVWGGKSC